MEKRYRVMPAAPVCQALQEVFDVMEKHGIIFHVTRLGMPVIRDKLGREYNLEHIESTQSHVDPVSCFPPTFEWKLIVNKWEK